MKKKNLVVKGMAMLMACAMVVGNNGMVAHAYFADDGTEHSDNAAGGSSASDGSDDIGGGSSSSNYSEPSGNSGSSSPSSSSYDDGCARSENEAGGSSASDGSDNIGASASYSAPAPKAAGSTASAGKEQFRALAKAGSGTYKVTHKGVEIATFTLMDADKKAVPCTAVALKKRDDGKYAINFEVADATGLTVGAPLDRTYLYSTLGISYVTIGDDNIVIDIEAEAQAAATK